MPLGTYAEAAAKMERLSREMNEDVHACRAYPDGVPVGTYVYDRNGNCMSQYMPCVPRIPGTEDMAEPDIEADTLEQCRVVLSRMSEERLDDIRALHWCWWTAGGRRERPFQAAQTCK